ncbi:MAG: hypothetical protein LBL73_08740, partial [Synergistaceae bacterium]|nr:hypothetical protein [Synergistaceae bacterium]
MPQGLESTGGARAVSYRPLAAFALSMILALCAGTAPASAAVDLPEELVSGTAVYEEAEQDKYRSPGMVTVIRPQER